MRRDDEQQQSSQAEGEPESQKSYEVQCWGCTFWLVLPTPTPIFKCGWCGALTIQKTPKVSRGKWETRLWTFRDRIFVIFVLVIIISILCGGVWASFPVLFPSFSLGLLLHTAITFLLSFNTLFNFIASSSIAPGPTRRISWGQVGAVQRGSLDGYRFCDHCKRPKPERVHHCRTCQTCVLDMDHHCPFIGNCVGANNHRYFLLFLVYTVVSSLYVFGMTLYTGSKVWPTVISISHLHNPEISLSFAMGATALAIMAGSLLESARALALLYLMVASLVIMIGVGVLLQQQLSFLYGGTRFLESIQTSSARVKGKERWENIQQVFGNGHPIFWALPILPETTPTKIHAR